MRWIGCHGMSGRLAIVPDAVDHAVGLCRNNLAFAVHYGLLDHWTAVAMNGLMAVQTLAAIGLMRNPQLRIVYVAPIPVMAAATFVTWQAVPSLLSAAATALSIIGRMQGDERRRAAIAKWNCFGAPAALFCYIDRDLGRPQWADVGMYLQSVMLLLRAEGLHSCPQIAWSQVR